MTEQLLIGYPKHLKQWNSGMEKNFRQWAESVLPLLSPSGKAFRAQLLAERNAKQAPKPNINRQVPSALLVVPSALLVVRDALARHVRAHKHARADEMACSTQDSVRNRLQSVYSLPQP